MFGAILRLTGDEEESGVEHLYIKVVERAANVVNIQDFFRKVLKVLKVLWRMITTNGKGAMSLSFPHI